MQKILHQNTHSELKVVNFQDCLIVTPSNCGQLQLARWFCSLYLSDQDMPVFAALENSAINPWLAYTMEEYDNEFDSRTPPTLFELYPNQRHFEQIFALGHIDTFEKQQPFFSTIRSLFGSDSSIRPINVHNPEDVILGTSAEMLKAAKELRDEIELEIAKLVEI